MMDYLEIDRSDPVIKLDTKLMLCIMIRNEAPLVLDRVMR